MVCSDSVGETANTVVQTTIRQFNASQVHVRRFEYMRTEEEIRSMMEELPDWAVLLFTR